MWVTCPRSASSGYHAEFNEGCYQKHTNSLNCRTSSLDISGYHVDLHEGHGTAGEWQGCGAAWHVIISLNKSRKQQKTGTVKTRNELAGVGFLVRKWNFLVGIRSDRF
jgi:hypothetical protein